MGNIALGVVSLVVGGIALWLGLGIATLVKRALYPTRSHARRTPASFGATFDAVRFAACEDLTELSGWFIPTHDERIYGAVILCHGMSKNREQMLPWAETFWKSGFHVLLFDFRALGESGGEQVSGGYLEARDVIGAVHYLAQRQECVGLALGVFGYSMGGVAAILAAAEEKRIRAIASHGAYTSFERAITQRCRHHFGPFALIAETIVRRVGAKRFPVPPTKVAPIQAVSRLAPRALLLLHGMCDPIVLVKDAQELYAQAGEPKMLCLLPNFDHRPVDPLRCKEVRSQVVTFFRDHLSEEAKNSVILLAL
ncbi:MAG TPA: alpha/beta fold hydrolase [Chthonomonadaceae bacterium]|nr:alpha/beta fold hydrolase [Chthonomonadaceae bacterium]